MSNIMENICDRFNKLYWHDSELLNIQILRSDDGKTDNICFEIKLHTNPQPGIYELENVKLTLKDCTIVKMDLDLDGKRACSNAIATAHCAIESDLKNYIEKKQLKYEKNPLAEYLHFKILLIHPGGEINIFAKDFDLEEVSGARLEK